MRPAPASPAPWPRRLLPGLALAGLVFLVFFPTLRGDFLWDDKDNVVGNPHLRDPQGLFAIWTDPFANQQYYPLTYTTFWIEYQLQGAEPFLYRLNNLVLHALAGIALWRVLRRLGLPGAWVAAALFALHPIQCESIAWVTERRNILAGLFAALSTLWFLRFAGVGELEPPRRPGKAWGLSLVFFALALFSKTAVAPLPAVFLALLWWKKPRLERRDLLASLPLFFLAFALACVTVAAEENSMPLEMRTSYGLDLAQRGVVAARGAWFYTGRLLFPTGLSFMYPRWDPAAFGWGDYLFPLTLPALLAGLAAGRRFWGKGPLAAALSYGLLLAPPSGFFAVAYFAFSFVADRFQYFAGPALLSLVTAAAAAGLARGIGNPKLRRGAAGAVSVLALSGLGILAHQRISLFETPESLWRATTVSSPRSWTPFYETGRILSIRGQYAEALKYLDEALRLEPRAGLAWSERGLVLAMEGNHAAAAEHYRKAIELKPRLVEAHNNLAIALYKLGDFEGAWQEVAATRALGTEPHADFLAALGRKKPPPP